MTLRLETTRPSEDDGIIELWPIGKLIVFGYLILALQSSVMGHLQSTWCHLDLTPIAIALVGIRMGVMTGALFGTVLAWFSLLLTGEPTGLPVLVGLGAGALAGRARDELMVDVWPVRLGAVLVLAALAQIVTEGAAALLFGHALGLTPLTFAMALPVIPVMDWLARRFTSET